MLVATIFSMRSEKVHTEVMKSPKAPRATTLLDRLDIIVDPPVWLGAAFTFDLEFL